MNGLIMMLELKKKSTEKLFRGVYKELIQTNFGKLYIHKYVFLILNINDLFIKLSGISFITSIVFFKTIKSAIQIYSVYIQSKS